MPSLPPTAVNSLPTRPPIAQRGGTEQEAGGGRHQRVDREHIDRLLDPMRAWRIGVGRHVERVARGGDE